MAFHRQRISSLVRSCSVGPALCVMLAGCAGPSLTPTTGALPTKSQQAGTTAPTKSAEKVDRPPVKVGLILPLTGPGQAGLIAENMKRAAELALIEHHAPHVQLLTRDDKGTPEAATAAVDELVEAGVEVVLGPLFSKSVAAVGPSARRRNIPVVAFSNDRQVAGQGTHLLSFLAPPEVQRVVTFAASRGKKRIAALVPDDSYGKIVEASLREAAGRAGGKVVALETYPALANGMLASVTKLRDAIRGVEEHGEPIDALFVPGGEDTLPTLMPQLKQAGIDMTRIKLIGTGALDYASAGRDPMVVGAWYAAPDPRGFKDFSEKFARAYGHAPPRIASLAYDAVGVAAALSAGPPGARYIPSQMTRVSGFTGVDGLFRLMQDGVTERALAILEVQPFGANVIDAAPATLGTNQSTADARDVAPRLN